MKKIFATLAIFGAMTFGFTSNALAQDEFGSDEATETVDESTTDESAAAPAEAAKPEEKKAEAAATTETKTEDVSMFKALRDKFIEGGAGFMSFVALCLILGLALCIERIVYLSLASVNSKKLLEDIEDSLDNDDVEGAMELCRNTRGPVASILYQGLSRLGEGPEVVEKTVVSYGGVQMGALEKNVTWISLCIALAPMLGFMGTVIGMIQAFDQIQQMGDMNATAVAGGIKVALLTTVFGLIVAMILQVFLNFILTRIEALTSEMEDSSISLLDLVVKYNASKKGSSVVVNE